MAPIIAACHARSRPPSPLFRLPLSPRRHAAVDIDIRRRRAAAAAAYRSRLAINDVFFLTLRYCRHTFRATPRR
jgi:hypothetical protein